MGFVTTVDENGDNHDDDDEDEDEDGIVSVLRPKSDDFDEIDEFGFEKLDVDFPRDVDFDADLRFRKRTAAFRAAIHKQRMKIPRRRI